MLSMFCQCSSVIAILSVRFCQGENQSPANGALKNAACNNGARASTERNVIGRETLPKLCATIKCPKNRPMSLPKKR